jgi:broad specificity phosphatase PhoE
MTAGADRVYLARHGRTALNAEGRLRGLSDPPLDEVGLAEAARLADVLANKHAVSAVRCNERSPPHRQSVQAAVCR